MEIRAYNIDWDTDDEIIEFLPSEVVLHCEPIEDDDDVSDLLSDKFGFCVIRCNWEILD